MSSADTLPEKEGFVLVRFTYGVDQADTVFYTNLDSSYGSYISVPNMELRLPPSEGGLSEREARISLPSDTFSDRLSNGIVTTPTYVQVTELSRPQAPAASVNRRVIFAGRVMKATRNYQGRQGLVAIFARPLKSRLDIPMGLQCNHQCILNFAEGACTANPLPASGTVDTVDGTKITCTNTLVVTDRPTDAEYYHRGTVTGPDGVTITIRKWDQANPTEFYLASAPPTSWAGEFATFKGGCDKTIETCRSRWSNESQFSGFGYSIPPYNPIIETPY